MTGQRDDPVLIYSTFPSLGEAEEVGHAMIAAQLVACVNIYPGMISLYEWQGQIVRASEVTALFKTRQALAERVMAEIKALHSYDTPALLVLPTAGGDKAYCDWISTAAGGADV